MVFNSSLITVPELVEALNDNAIILLDCTIDKVGKSLKGKKLELIPNSYFFDIEGKLSDKKSKLPHTLVSPEVFEQEMQKLGINQNSTVVLYDRWGVYSSPRAWWMFKVMGFDNVYVLNGGLPTWKKSKKPIENAYTKPLKVGDFKANFRAEWIADKEYILERYKAKTVDIFDARSKGRFVGLVPEPRKGLKGGHIPHSKNIPFEELLNGESYVDKETVESIFQAQKPSTDEYVFTCGSGITASILAFGSHLIGQQKIRVYDGSWSEWGMDELNLPTEK
ncbi:MAG: sulfurtransferase [Sphingobacterium composti]|uniref:sulfurtransferase n=1 Tax=Sphingobacterium composti TaxID=363260 RepID=UPI00135CD5EA|nr:sulfurtransferase [Sphingobacterium composti Ten et al. 2007 non Yoo et al. 2007]